MQLYSFGHTNNHASNPSQKHQSTLTKLITRNYSKADLRGRKDSVETSSFRSTCRINC